MSTPFKCPVSREQAITDIIESIASEQSALSKVIASESDKLDKYLECCIPPHEMLKINDSVKETLNTITRLENLLLAKLELVSCDICKDKEKEHCE